MVASGTGRPMGTRASGFNPTIGSGITRRSWGRVWDSTSRTPLDSMPGRWGRSTASALLSCPGGGGVRCRAWRRATGRLASRRLTAEGVLPGSEDRRLAARYALLVRQLPDHAVAYPEAPAGLRDSQAAVA